MEGAAFRSQMGSLSGTLLWLSAYTESLPELNPLRITTNDHPLLYAETLENAQRATWRASGPHERKERGRESALKGVSRDVFRGVLKVFHSI